MFFLCNKVVIRNVLSAVYLNQRIGALHTVCWSKSEFWYFNIYICHKGKRRKALKGKKQKGVNQRLDATPKYWQTPKGWSIPGKSDFS